jgi:hypothetical protein
MTPEQAAAYAGMGDIGGDIDVMEQQTALADKLRQGYLGNARKDVGSQIGKAALGIGGAMAQKQGMDMNAGIASKRQALMAQLIRAYGGGAAGPTGPVPQEMGY